MGLRFRKSINLGGGFRINLSKSGIGYSWGTKGYRITKTARGTVRQTISIPGTGISYTEESHAQKTPSTPPKQTQALQNQNYYGTEEIVNSNASMMVSDGLHDILSAAKKTLVVNKVSTVGIVICLFFLAFPLAPIWLLAFVALKIYAHTKGRIDLEYEIDEDQKPVVAQRMDPMLRVTTSKKVWRIVQSNKVINTKYSAGANNTVKRVLCKTSQKSPFPFKTNLPVASFKMGKENLIFFPDKLLIIQGRKIGALNYSDITASASTTRFIEDEAVPKDARVVGQTWKYVNKSGGPDMRFKNNKQIPICLYGKLHLQSLSGLNTVIMFSNADLK